MIKSGIFSKIQEAVTAARVGVDECCGPCFFKKRATFYVLYGLFLLQTPTSTFAATPYSEKVWLQTLIRELPELATEKRHSWPLVLWHGVGFDPLDSRDLQALYKRGIAQHVRLDPVDINTARQIQAAGLPVMVLEGKGGNWPYNPVGGRDPYLPLDSSGMLAVPDPWNMQAWMRQADRLRQILTDFRNAAIDIQAFWLDYEGSVVNRAYPALLLAGRGPILERFGVFDEIDYHSYQRKRWLENLDRFVAGPILTVYPRSAVSNWVVMYSSRSFPVLSWLDWSHPVTPRLQFTHSSPIAYGIDTYFINRQNKTYLENPRIRSQHYATLLLRQVSADSYNRHRLAPDRKAAVWVSRVVRDHPDVDIPGWSRARYREVLRHLWMRGIDNMLVFNPSPLTDLQASLHEVQDVQAVYLEMLQYLPYLQRGRVMNYRYSRLLQEGWIWSGLKLGNKAFLRIANFGSTIRTAKIPIGGGRFFQTAMPVVSETHVLNLH